MTVVADSSPLRYLILINQVQILDTLFHRVLVPETVARELSHDRTPEPIRKWMLTPPHWIEVHKPPFPEIVGLDHLDQGEFHAIALAQQSAASLLLIDDGEARSAAESLGFGVLGTIGILERAERSGLLDFADAFSNLEKTNFHMSACLRHHIRERYRFNS